MDIKRLFRRKKYVVLVTWPEHGYYGNDPVGSYANYPKDALKLSRLEAKALERDLLYRYISSVALEYKEK